MKKHIYIECNCSSDRHVLRFTYFPDDKDFIYVENYMKDLGFFKRLKIAAMYLIGFNLPSSDTVLIDSKSARELEMLCKEFIS